MSLTVAPYAFENGLAAVEAGEHEHSGGDGCVHGNDGFRRHGKLAALHEDFTAVAGHERAAGGKHAHHLTKKARFLFRKGDAAGSFPEGRSQHKGGHEIFGQIVGQNKLAGHHAGTFEANGKAVLRGDDVGEANAHLRQEAAQGSEVEEAQGAVARELEAGRHAHAHGDDEPEVEGIVANMDFILICTYEENGENPELVVYKKR